MQTAEINHLAFCYFLRDVVMNIVGLRNEKLTNCNGLDLDSSLRSE